MSSRPSEDSLTGPPTKIRRTKLACARCQTRKIRCDGGVPKCSNCQRAGAECSDGKSTLDGGISRGEAASLFSQIQRLESALRTRCPDLDLDGVKEGQIDVNTAEVGSVGSTVSHASAIHALRDPVAPSQNNNTAPALSEQYPEVQDQASNAVAHEIGLVPMSTGGTKYIGPSSGFNFARLIYAKAGQKRTSAATPESSGNHPSPSTTRSRSGFPNSRITLPETSDDALQLAAIYFEFLHFQYPILHKASHKELIEDVYSNRQASPIARFQVNMVSAISAIILSQRARCAYSGEDIAATTMIQASDVDFQSSLQGLQCLLLIYVYTLHSPSLGLNPWYLNYQSLATVIDLGLQRDVPLGKTMNPLSREMRTRVFWVAYSIDRSLGTTLGRPIGLRDEACELRFPVLTANPASDSRTESPSESGDKDDTSSGSFILFKLAQLNSEMKYILHSISRDVPRYTYPSIPNIGEWQSDIYTRLQQIHLDIQGLGSDDDYTRRGCLIRYHELVMLLFRPSPRIRKPDSPALRHCYQSAQASLTLWKELYDSDRLVYTWTMVHSLCLSLITMLYSIWMAHDIAAQVKIDELMAVTGHASNLLTVAGEHWPEARSSRDSLASLSSATLRWLFDLRLKSSTSTMAQPSNELPDLETSDPASYQFDLPNFDAYLNTDDLALFVGAPDPFAADFSLTMDGMFSDYQPLFDLDTYLDSAADS